MTELPEPTAQGDLSRTPFAHALLYCHQRELGGTLVVWPETPETTRGQDRIRFEAGVPVAARLTQRAAALDRGLLPFFSRREGAYAFYADIDLVGDGEAVRAGRVDPYRLIAASLRGPSRDDAIDAVLAAFGDRPVRLRPGSELSRFELLAKESAFIDAVRAEPASIAVLAPLCELGETAGRRLLYLLAITKLIEPWSAGAGAPSAAPRPIASGAPASTEAGPHALPRASEPVARGERASEGGSRRAGASESGARGARPKLAAEVPPPPPAELAADMRALWSEAAARAVEIDKQNYFEMLGLTRDSNAEAVRKAYFGLVKKWHPDRVPPELAPIKPFVERIFHHLTAAQKTLSDETERGRYLSSVVDGGGTPESERQLAAILQAAMDHQKAEVLLRRRDFAGAIELLRGAIELSPEDADAHATLAWALYQRSPGTDDLREMLAEADQAIAHNPKSDRAHYYRGMILRRAGREAEALALLERAAELNPKNVDAVREVRIARMRGGKPSLAPAEGGGARPAAPAKDGGIFSKLFGGKKEK